MSNIPFESLLSHVTVDSKDDGEKFIVDNRIHAIVTFLSSTRFKLQHKGRLCMLYSKQPLEGREVVVVSSHIDCVYQKCFCDCQEDYLRGTFDNSLTNALVLQLMADDRLGEDVVVSFTGDEECGSNGCLEAMHVLRKKGCRIRFAVVADVTNAGWTEGNAFTLENDQGIDLLTAHRLVESLEDFQGSYTLVHDAEADESWDYFEQGVPCLSLCVPVEGELHAEAGVCARQENLPVYQEALVKLLGAL